MYNFDLMPGLDVSCKHREWIGLGQQNGPMSNSDPPGQKASSQPCETFKPNFLDLSLRAFGSTSTISRFGERFLDVQYSLVSFLFAVLLLTVSLCPAI